MVGVGVLAPERGRGPGGPWLSLLAAPRVRMRTRTRVRLWPAHGGAGRAARRRGEAGERAASPCRLRRCLSGCCAGAAACRMLPPRPPAPPHAVTGSLRWPCMYASGSRSRGGCRRRRPLSPHHHRALKMTTRSPGRPATSQLWQRAAAPYPPGRRCVLPFRTQSGTAAADDAPWYSSWHAGRWWWGCRRRCCATPRTRGGCASRVVRHREPRSRNPGCCFDHAQARSTRLGVARSAESGRWW